MVRSRHRLPILAAAALLVGACAAQAQEASGPAPEVLQARYHVALMEAALEQAVRLGASQMNLQLQAAGPEMVFLTGSPRARGFRLDDYGIFFHVDVPVMRRSLAWTVRALRQHDGMSLAALQELRRRIEALDDPSVREALEPAVRQIEQAMPVRAASTSGDVRRSPAAPVTEGRRRTAPVEDPGQAYTAAVKAALVNAMLEYSTRLSIGADEWLTIAARDQEGSRLEAGDPYAVSTMVLRIRGADLQAFHAGRIDAAEARSRVVANEN